MRLRKATLAGLVLAGAAAALAIVFGGGDATHRAKAAEPPPGVPTVSIVSPRNGEVQANHAVVVKVDLDSFELAPQNFLGEPQLGQGAIRFSLNRVPNCVDPQKLRRAIKSPLGNERLTGKSMDIAQYAGPNGVLAEELGTAPDFSPATRPQIFYHGLPPGFYRLTVTLAQNNLAVTPHHDVTNFQILQRPGHHQKKCRAGYVSSAKAAKVTH